MRARYLQRAVPAREVYVIYGQALPTRTKVSTSDNDAKLDQRTRPRNSKGWQVVTRGI